MPGLALMRRGKWDVVRKMWLFIYVLVVAGRPLARDRASSTAQMLAVRERVGEVICCVGVVHRWRSNGRICDSVWRSPRPRVTGKEG